MFYNVNQKLFYFYDFIDLDVGEAWTLDSDDELSCYGDDLNVMPGINVDEEETSTKSDDIVTLQVDRKSSTGSQVNIDIRAMSITVPQ